MLRNTLFFLLLQTHHFIYAHDIDNDRHMHRQLHKRDLSQPSKPYNPEEKTADYWRYQAQLSLSKQLSKQPKFDIAKNVILFLGDGMSIPTIAAARAYLGQSEGKPGEETQLSFEKFPYTGFSKTYCVDRQVADSACSATAYLCGIKANEGTIGVTAAVPLGHCELSQNGTNHVHSIARWFQLVGKRTGVVTTTRITHASPAGIYAHIAHRDWESDTEVLKAKVNLGLCPDIASQLIHSETGQNLNVIFGGGRNKFLPTSDENKAGRSDSRNLIEEWKELKANTSHEYVSDRPGLLNVSDQTEYVLGLFSKEHTPYNMDRNPSLDPSLEEMTRKAIRLLSKGHKGYFLFVEGGRIDHAHHESQAQKALNETIEFHKAVEAAIEMTDDEHTLILVTSDHAHTMTVSGYPTRGNDILGLAGDADDKLPYSTIAYANGPGYKKEEKGRRLDLSKDNMRDKEYRFPSAVPLEAETHGGEDVAIFAHGPWAHLFTGVIEQNVIPHILAYTSCVGDGITICDEIVRK